MYSVPGDLYDNLLIQPSGKKGFVKIIKKKKIFKTYPICNYYLAIEMHSRHPKFYKNVLLFVGLKAYDLSLQNGNIYNLI